MYWCLKLRKGHLLFTASAHVFISSYTSVAAVLRLKCCVCPLGMMFPVTFR